jgi:hypothetical protein
MATHLTGGCLCKAVRYESTGDPAMAGHCYCRDCQYSSGGSNSSGVFVPKATFKLTKGQLKHYEVTADSGQKVSRGFCANCGSPLVSTLTALPDLIEIRAGSLDDPNQVKLGMNIFMASAPKWAPVDRGLPTFDRMPG